jgi:pimeloyl-ACP methyl ester carboxylesterase
METPVIHSHVRVRGHGERLVFIHGSNIASAEFLWSAQLELAAQYQVVVPDRRGYGASPDTCDQGGYEANVRDIVSWLDRGAHLIGHSYGGVLAMAAAARAPELVKSLVIIEPPAFGVTIQHPVVARVVAGLKQVYGAARTPEDFLAGFLRAMGVKVVEPLHLSPLHRKAVTATMAEVEPWNIELDLARVASHAFPKLVVSGDWHPALVVTAEALAQQLGAQRLVIKGVGHEIQKVAKLFNDRLKDLVHSTMPHAVTAEAG